MALVRWEPRSLSGLQQGIDQLFDKFWRRHSERDIFTSRHPTMDVEESDDAYVITADLPGIPRENIKLQMVNNTLILSGERKSEHKDETTHSMKRSYGSFRRSFSLPSQVDEAQMTAKYNDGVLTITLPKAEEAKAKLIEVT